MARGNKGKDKNMTQDRVGDLSGGDANGDSQSVDEGTGLNQAELDAELAAAGETTDEAEARKRGEPKVDENGDSARDRYMKSEKGLAAREKYMKSEKGAAARKAYMKSEKGLSTRKKYMESEKGKAARKKYMESPKFKEAQARWRAGQKERKAAAKAEKDALAAEQKANEPVAATV